MPDYDKAFAIVWRRENGSDTKIAVSDDPNDPGGYTRGGVALNRHPELTRAALDSWTIPDFKTFYEAHYWLSNKCDQLHWPLNLVVFDGEVNASAEGAIALQSVLQIEMDGVIGPYTVRAANARDPVALAMLTSIARDSFYRKSHNFDIYGNGWLTRLFQNMYEAGQADIV